MKFQVKKQALAQAKEATKIVAVFQDEKKKPFLHCERTYQESLKKLAETKAFTGAKGSLYFLRTLDKKDNLLFVGLGKPSEVTTECFRIAGAKITNQLNAEKISAAALCLDSCHVKNINKKVSIEATMQALAEGIILTKYRFNKYKKPNNDAVNLESITFCSTVKEQAKLQDALQTAQLTGEAVYIARDLSNEPGNILVPMELAKRAQQFAKKYGLRCTILRGAQLKKEKMGGLIGVGQGSANPPCMIILEYKPKKMTKKTKKIAFVGKAITFDSGGISIKPSAAMEEMKHDMSGGANVLAILLTAAKLKCPNHLYGVIAAAENMPSGTAIVPSTVLFTRAGKTIEVQNTDAEGRLVLSDALDYAQDYKPDAVIDLATLTGAVVVALGAVASAIMGNSEKLLDKIKTAARETGEKHWELPIYPEFTDEMKGKITDLKNISSSRGAGSSTAGAFLQAFIRPGVDWVHIDIAGTAWNQKHLEYAAQAGATGHGIRTLVKLAMDF